MKQFPNAFVIMLGIVFLAWVLTWLIPQGAYQRATDPDTSRVSVLGDSYDQIEADHMSVFDLMIAIPDGLEDRADLIILILLVGGCFYLIEQTGALGQALQKIINLLSGREVLALILVSVLFAAAGATIGLQEEIVAMAPILILFSRSLGYNAMVALSISYGSAVVGAAFSPMNPFAVVLAQKEAQIALLSGGVFRLIVFALALALWTGYILHYGKKNQVPAEPMIEGPARLSVRSIAILGMLCLTFSVVTFGLLSWDWGLKEITACFFALGVVVCLVPGMGLNRSAMTFVDGMKEMTFAAIIMGLASCIPLILERGMVIDTLIHGLFAPMQDLPASGSALGMMLSQALLHFPVSSYSGQALLTMPILIPLSDLVGVSRQVCVLAYQYGAVNMDLVVPTNGALMAIIALAGISYNQWLRFIWKPFLLLFGLSALAVVMAVWTGLQ